MFEPPIKLGPREEKETSGTRGSREAVRYEGFGHFVQNFITQAYAEEFALQNPGKGYQDTNLVSPSFEAVLRRFRQHLDEPFLGWNNESPTSALRQLRAELIFGVTSKPLAEKSEEMAPDGMLLRLRTGNHWNQDGPQLKRASLTISTQVLEEAGGNVRAHGTPIQAPYLFAAVTKRVGDTHEVIKLIRVPVACHQTWFYLVESRPERRATEFLAEVGVALIKPHVQLDVRLLGDRLWPLTATRGDMPSRPDILAFLNGKLAIVFLTSSTTKEILSKARQSVEVTRKFFEGCLDVVVKSLDVDDLISRGPTALLD
jgi:hypothetical protein